MTDQPAVPTGQRPLPRGLILLLGLAAAVIIVAGMHGAAGLLSVTFLTLILTVAVHPFQQLLANRLPGWLATVVCLLCVYLLLVGLACLLFVSTAQFTSALPQYEAELDRLVQRFTTALAGLGVEPESLQAMVAQLDLSKLTAILTSALAGVLGVVSNIVFIISLLLFMTIDGARFPRLLGAARRFRPSMISALVDFVRTTRRYLRVSTMFGAIVAVLDTVFLIAMGIPTPLLWGILAFLTNYIPNIGFVIGLIPPAILALLVGGPGLMIAVIAVYCVINVIIQSVIQPKVVGDTVGLSPTLTFLSLIFWAWVLGPLGAVLAVPLTLLTRAILIDSDPGNRWLLPLVANREQQSTE